MPSDAAAPSIQVEDLSDESDDGRSDTSSNSDGEDDVEAEDRGFSLDTAEDVALDMDVIEEEEDENGGD